MILGYPAAVIPAGEHPVNAKCRRRIYPPFSACKTTPAVRKILPIFPTAFTGCNTLHFALQSRVPDVPSGLPYGRSYALLILRSTLRIKEWQHDGDGSCEGVFQKHRHHRHDRHAGNKSFIKSYAAVCLEGAVIVLACIIFSLFASSPPVVNPDAAAVSMVWSYIGELVFNMLVLVGAVKMADRVVREMMGL